MINNVIQTSEAKSLAEDEGSADGDDFIGEAHVALGGDATLVLWRRWWLGPPKGNDHI